MKLIDFDSRFAQYLRGWMAAHEDDYKDPEDMERDVPDVYERFLDTPAEWLDGQKPGEYFGQWDDPALLVNWLKAYLAGKVSVPDMLLNRLAALGEAAAPHVLALLDESDATGEKKMLAVTLLREMDSPLPLQRYVDWQCGRADLDDLCDSALESLEQQADAIRPQMLDALMGATPAGREALLSVLCRQPGDPRVLEELLRLFGERPERRAILAAYLGRLGDPEALPDLLAAANEDGLKYLDYIEIRSAIESLGGEPPEREFFEDAEYDALFGAQR